MSIMQRMGEIEWYNDYKEQYSLFLEFVKYYKKKFDLFLVIRFKNLLLLIYVKFQLQKIKLQFRFVFYKNFWLDNKVCRFLSCELFCVGI